MRRLSILALIGLALLGGCAAESYPTGMFRAQYNAPYTLASGDRVRVIVFGQDSMSNSYAVSGLGRISMPLTGEVPLGHHVGRRQRDVVLDQRRVLGGRAELEHLEAR